MKLLKKAELSINVVVLAAIGIIVLVILALIVTGAGSRLIKGTSCEGLQGVCVDSYYESCQEYAEAMNQETIYSRDASGKCARDQFCCIPLAS